MKISEAVELKNLLSELVDDTSYMTAIDEYISRLNHALGLYPEHGGSRKSIRRVCDDTRVAARQIHGPIIDIIDNIDAYIDQHARRLYRESLNTYLLEKDHLEESQILGRRMRLDDEIMSDLKYRIKGYSNWKYPGLVIRPSQENFLSHVVDCDPMYIADQSDNLLLPSMLQFPELYKERLRMITTTENLSNQPFLSAVPESQLGLCLAFYFFNFKPIEIIEQYFKEIFIKLRPGGYFAFTFNNCERQCGVDLAENKVAAYTPRTRIMLLLEDLGFEVLHEIHDWAELHWVECKKPGELDSNRGGQVLARVNPHTQNVELTVDNATEKVYTSEEISMLREIAISLNIADEKLIRNGNYAPEILERHIRRKLQNRQNRQTRLTTEDIENLYNQRKIL